MRDTRFESGTRGDIDGHQFAVTRNEIQLLAVVPPARRRSPSIRHRPFAAVGIGEGLYVDLRPARRIRTVGYIPAIPGEGALALVKRGIQVWLRLSIFPSHRKRPQIVPRRGISGGTLAGHAIEKESVTRPVTGKLVFIRLKNRH